MNYLERIKVDKSSVNNNHSSCPTKFLVARHGTPRKVLSTKCEPVTSQYWRSRMVTKDVGPFRCTGFDLFVDLLTRAFSELKLVYPDLYDKVSSAGCLCCRKVRGGESLSNHGLGFAIDLLIDGKLDDYGDGYSYSGLLTIYSIFKKHGFYWGIGFPKEDSMHFEASKETIMDWVTKGKL